MRVQIANDTGHELKVEIFDVEEKHNCRESHHEFVHRDYCHQCDCHKEHCGKHHNDNLHCDYMKLGHHYDGHHHHNGYYHHDFCHMHRCKCHRCARNDCNKRDYCEHHKCDRNVCKNHHNERNDFCHRTRSIRSFKDKTFDMDFENVIYVRNREKKISAIFGFDVKGHLFYHKCANVKCEIVKNNKHIKITFKC